MSAKSSKSVKKANPIVLVLFLLWCGVTFIGTLGIICSGGIASSAGDWIVRLVITAVFWFIMGILFFALDWIPDREFDFFKRGLGAVLAPEQDEDTEVEEEPVSRRKTPPASIKKPAPTARRVTTPTPPPATPKDKDDESDDDPVLI